MQGVPLGFFQFFGPKFFVGCLSFDDWTWLRETENGWNRCLLLNLSILNGAGEAAVHGRQVGALPNTKRRLTMHIVFPIRNQHRQGPKCIFFVHVHQKQRRYLRHSLAIPDFSVVHGIRSEYVKQGLLLKTISFPEHDVVSIRSIHIQVDLPDIRRPAPRDFTHFLENKAEPRLLSRPTTPK